MILDICFMLMIAQKNLLNIINSFLLRFFNLFFSRVMFCCSHFWIVLDFLDLFRGDGFKGLAIFVFFGFGTCVCEYIG